MVAVFIPLLFMGGLVGRTFHEFAMTLTMAILVSGVLALTLTPMLCARFLKADKDYPAPGVFYRMCENVFNYVLGVYSRGLKWVLRHQHFMLLVALVTFVATVWLYGIVPKGFCAAAGHGDVARDDGRLAGYFV